MPHDQRDAVARAGPRGYDPVMAHARWMGASFVLLLTACGSYGTRVVTLTSYPGPTDQNGVVCIVRGEDEGDVEPPVPVWDNGVLVGATRSRSHFCYLAARGHHVITSEALVTAELPLRVEANARYGIAQEVGRSIYLPGKPWVMLGYASDAQVAEAMTHTDHVALTEVPRDEVLPTGGAVPADP
ncbi:hypothetical protein LVJ94_00570 [Pendulispora rubella]|uniref:Uncharacterized protein n=1 Tax=Pendulispora rubella TaxID=2741070 RepID=A0ABZ2L978_9BACT